MVKKKIFIIIAIVFILCFSLFFGIYFYRKHLTKKEIAISDNLSDINNTITDNENLQITENTIQTNIIDDEIITESTVEPSENIISSTETETETETNTNTENTQPALAPSVPTQVHQTQKTSITSQTEQEKQPSSIKETNTQEIKTPQVTQIAQEPTQNEETNDTQTNTNTEPTITNNVTQKTNEEKYVKNDIMINKIKSVIENNLTENMKQYGYEIVVDSSIKGKTNQFTFTESRVISNIKYSFGTIRIYAEDYYSDGQLVSTNCYIF